MSISGLSWSTSQCQRSLGLTILSPAFALLPIKATTLTSSLVMNCHRLAPHILESIILIDSGSLVQRYFLLSFLAYGQQQSSVMPGLPSWMYFSVLVKGVSSASPGGQQESGRSITWSSTLALLSPQASGFPSLEYRGSSSPSASLESTLVTFHATFW